jgi:hypothetical protein
LGKGRELFPDKESIDIKLESWSETMVATHIWISLPLGKCPPSFGLLLGF